MATSTGFGAPVGLLVRAGLVAVLLAVPIRAEEPANLSELLAEPPPREESSAPAPGRYCVSDRKVPVFVAKDQVGWLYRWCVLEAGSAAGEPGAMDLLELRSGWVHIGEMAPPENLDDLAARCGVGSDPIRLRNSRLRVRANLAGGRQLTFRIQRDKTSTGPKLCARLMPEHASVAAAGLVPLAAGEEEPANRRFEGSEVEAICLEAGGSFDRPSLSEIPPDDPRTGRVAELDYEGGLGDELAYYKRLVPNRPLYVIVPTSSGRQIAYSDNLVPIPDRSRAVRGTFQAELQDGSKAELREPVEILAFPRQYLQDHTENRVLSTFKHELAHLLQSLIAPINHDDYESTFKSHAVELRTSSRDAFVEGFAEYAQFKFRDSESEAAPASLDALILRKHRRHYEDLLWFYWTAFRSDPAVLSRLKPKDLDGFSKTFDDQLSSPADLPSFAAMQNALVASLAGKGSPPLTAVGAQELVNTFNASNASGVANLSDEELSPEDNRRIAEARDALLKSVSGPGLATPAYGQFAEPLVTPPLRTATDLLLTEGVVARALFELDQKLSTAKLDFFGKVLKALAVDPYATGSQPISYPPQPVNFKELVAVLDRDPELHGKIIPIISRSTGGILTESDFKLHARREYEPLDVARPGTSPARRDQNGQLSGEADHRHEDAPQFDGIRGR